MNPIGKGTRRELMLAARALKVARAHLAQARCGLHDSADEAALLVTIDLHNLLSAVAGIPLLAMTKQSKRREPA